MMIPRDLRIPLKKNSADFDAARPPSANSETEADFFLFHSQFIKYT